MTNWIHRTGSPHLLVVLLTVLCYALLFGPIRTVGGDAVGSLSVVPVLVAGIYMSRKGAWLVALCVTILNGFLFATVNPTSGGYEQGTGALLGTFALFITAELAGRARDAEGRLERSGMSKHEFLAGVSHELRTPLTALVGYSSVLRSGWRDLDEAERSETVAIIHQQSTELAAIVEDLLVSSRLDNEELTIAHRPVGLAHEIDSVVASLPAPAYSNLTVSVPASVEVVGDSSRIRQVLRNLVINAYRYGGAAIEIESTDTDEITRLSIRDNGIALPRKEWELMFEAYYRCGDRIGQPESVGLGLTVSRKLARAMGGDLVYEGDDEGSVFSLSLPSVTHKAEPIQRLSA
ncbi:N/A [soil metagenome]